MSWNWFHLSCHNRAKKKNITQCQWSICLQVSYIWNRADESINNQCDFIELIPLHLHHDSLKLSFSTLFYVCHQFCFGSGILNRHFIGEESERVREMRSRQTTSHICWHKNVTCHLMRMENSIEQSMEWIFLRFFFSSFPGFYAIVLFGSH